MIKYLLLTSFVLISCVSNQTNEQSSVNSILSLNMDISEFKTKLEKYAKESSYPKLEGYE
mgnify:CR=1 FL=1|tara:strand:- start:124 stop:303 length:180 start_codon:yes stop_codon:yes gene_type:complete